jgi:hypothetical protein
MAQVGATSRPRGDIAQADAGSQIWTNRDLVLAERSAFTPLSLLCLTTFFLPTLSCNCFLDELNSCRHAFTVGGKKAEVLFDPLRREVEGR